MFKSAPELVALLQEVESEYMRHREHPRRQKAEGQYADVLPWLQDQALSFEAAANASNQDQLSTTSMVRR